jgi:uncharacterized membrane protein
MAKDVSETVRDALTSVAREALKNAAGVAPQKSRSGPLAGGKGVAAGVGLAALAPLAAKKGMEAVRLNGGLPTPAPGKLAGKAGDRVGSKVKDAVSSKVDEAGGAGGLVKEAASGLLPGGGDGGGGKDGMPGVGKGRRMPVQQSVDVAVPIETAYNQWTQFEDWPEFMHRVTRVTQDDDCNLSFATKIWGKTKEFKAEIETQRPDERIKWRVSEGITHSGVVTFHELAARLTRIEVTLDVDPGSLIEKAARGMRHIKRAVRSDLARYKAFIEMQEMETGAWRGVIEDGEVVEPHDDSYDEERDYAEVSDIYESESPDSEDEEDEDDDSQRTRAQRFKRQAERSSGGSSSSSSSKRGSSSSKSGSTSRSRGSGSSKSGSSSSKSGSSSSKSGTSSRSRGSGSSKSGSSSSKRGSTSSRRTAAASKPRSSRTAGSGSSTRSNGSSSKRSSSSSSTKRKAAGRS